ncbi:MAG: bifunctional folylpolyglutamate synthase/dihydrofolate synthase, partial [Bacteroidales bacterium]|nr:bifunctional folylpolyglutamate synthase/dihydrofolate synthase [Bacteroidales bacterium]
MTYQETITYLFSKLPMYQRQGKSAFKKNMNNIIALCEHSDNPQNKFKSIHIAGTNGKGSVSHILASVLQTSGYKTGLYTSPHLKDFRERIKINGEMISEEEVINYVEENKSFFEELQPSFFEMTVALAFKYFADENVDIAVIEVGLGGRLDSTNIINPELSVITNISIDHTQFLGETLSQIAGEKAGIIKEKTPVVIGEYQEDIVHIFSETAFKKKSPVYFADKEYYTDYEMMTADYKQILNIKRNNKTEYSNLKTDLFGGWQNKNIITALKSLEILNQDFNISKENIYNGILNIKKNTNFIGRWQILAYNPLTITDTGHNEAGIKEVVRQIKKTPYK